MAFDFSKKFPFLDGASPQAEESSVQAEKVQEGEKRGGLNGWPFVNYGEQRYKSPRALVLPRQKYTWFAEFDVNQDYIDSGRMSTNLRTFLVNNQNRIYLNLKRIDHPKPNMTVDTLRSHNKYVKVPTKVEYPPAQMTLDDDATSIIVALWKEYFAFYSHVGDVGFEELRGAPSLVSADEDNAFAFDKNMGTHGYGHLVSSEGTEPRRSMDIRGSMGMRLKANQHRHFFDRIVLYDLGTEPSSVNVYYYYRPVITSFDHADVDWEDRSGKVEASVTFEYENYYFALGMNISKVAEVVERVTGVKPSYTPEPLPVNAHGKMLTPEFPDIPPIENNNTDSPKPILIGNQGEQPTFNDPPADPPPDTGDLDKEKARIQGEYQALIASCSSAQDSERCIKGRARLEQELDDIDAKIAESRKFQSEKEKEARNDPSTKDAQKNTEDANGLAANEPKGTDAVFKQQQRDLVERELESTIKQEDIQRRVRDKMVENNEKLLEVLKLSEKGALPRGKGSLTPLEFSKLQDQITAWDKQIAQASKQILLLNNRIEQLERTLENR